MNEDNGLGESGMWQRLKESPRTVSALIIILIVAAAIYAFSGEETTKSEMPDKSDVAVTEEEGEEVIQKEPKIAAGVTGSEEVGEVIPEAKRTKEGYVEVAQAGDGFTHLARRATTRWLSENQTSYAVTDEHRIYIEDYIQNQLGTQGLKPGDTHTVSFDVIAEAVTAAENLSEQQLQNLTQYTGALK